MHENILSKYKRVYSRHPSQLNLVHIWYHKDVETERDLEQARKKVNDILRHMESFYEKYKSFNWDDEISSRLTSYRNATQQGKKIPVNGAKAHTDTFLLRDKNALKHKKEL